MVCWHIINDRLVRRSFGLRRNVLLSAFQARDAIAPTGKSSDDGGNDKSNVASEARLCMQMTKARVCVGLRASPQAYDSYLRFLVQRDMTDQSEFAHQ